MDLLIRNKLSAGKELMSSLQKLSWKLPNLTIKHLANMLDQV